MTHYNIDQIKSSVRIEDVAGGYVNLLRCGKLFKGLCPFHDDHHPSLIVDPQKQTFTCYACGEHGDVIAFVQKMERCSFVEATEKLKIENGKLKINKTKAKPVKEKSDKNKFSIFNSQYSIEKNCKFFSSLLPYACGDSELTPVYLDFEVGVSPGMVPKEWYAMRGRVIFPIRDEEGGLIGFAARKQSDGNPDEPKYINTSAANGYKKSDHLYGLYRAKEAIAERGLVYLVEGYKDVIAMHAAGFVNTVALCGTALCDGHIRLLKKYASQAVVLLDGDEAGRKATATAVASLRREGILAVGGELPEGEDPDSLFRSGGKEAFAKFICKMQRNLFASEEMLLLNRICSQVRVLMWKEIEGNREELFRNLGTMLAHRTGLSLRDGRPGTMDWRWL
ncbi:CHC2 zinc finger domain-containing protein [Parabacteroides segnis]|uniref:DNA primase n=1 Tax=Parabacteroides segnis TaxID=2763058 RepID=UPI003511A21A